MPAIKLPSVNRAKAFRSRPRHGQNSAKAAVFLAALILTSCGDESVDSGGPPSADVSDADAVVVAEDIKFVDPPTQLEPGDLTLAIDNQGRLPHDVTIEEIGTIVEASGGGQHVAKVTLEPGSYTAYCSVPGHREAGMEYQVTVK